MRKFTLVLLTLVLFISPLFLTPKALAQIETGSVGVSEPAIGPVPDYQTGTFLGQKQSYTVTFRGNGEAVVSARISIGNSSDTTIDKVSFRIPKVEASGIYAFQIFMEKQCIRYATPQYDPLTRSYPVNTCAQYQDPDYYNSYSFYNAKYKKADYDYKNDTLTVTLPSSIEVNKSGAIFLYFRAAGYVKKDMFGAFDYTFETLQVEDPVQSLNIGIATDSDLYLKGVQGEVNYRFSDVTASVAKLGSGGGEMGIASPAMDTYVSQIGQGSIYKTASNLSPLESYKVTGSYANTRAKLYGSEILIGVVVFVGLLAIIILSVVAIIRVLRKPSQKALKKEDAADEMKSTPLPSQKTSSGKMFAVVVMLGFIDSLIVTVYTVLVVLLGAFLINNIYYSYQGFVMLALVIISIIIYVLLVFSPGVLLGVRKGAAWGIGAVVSTVLWMIFWVIILVLLFLLFGKGDTGLFNLLKPVTPMMY